MKVALITGAARGIGEGLARALAEKGYAVSLVGLEIERMRAIALELGENVAAFEADVTDTEALERAVALTLLKFGHINVVVCNAGISNNGTFASTHVEDLARVVNVNLIGVIRTMKACYASLLDTRGYALMISSASAFPALPGITAYGAAKAGVDHLANNLRVEMAPEGVDVGVAYPSWIETDLVRDLRDEMPYFQKALDSNWLGPVTSLDECTAMLVEGIEGRRRRIYIPESIGFLHAFRSLAVSKVWDFAVGLAAKRIAPTVNEGERPPGHAFGKTSVESARK